ncbi:MAG: hypothetical protein AAF039_04735 [Bacteroidota bacterium]
MNKYGHIVFSCLFIIGCQGQQGSSFDSMPQSLKDSTIAVLDSLDKPVTKTKLKDTLPKKKMASEVTVKIKKGVPKKKPEKKTAPMAEQVQTTTIWTDEQKAFLEKVDKILLFDVRTTDIGSRKLELDSQLDQKRHEEFIKKLLNQKSYPSMELVESSDGKKFTPNYQILLESSEEKLTLMFDAEGLKMVVANLYGREKYAINPFLMEYVEKLKTGQ